MNRQLPNIISNCCAGGYLYKKMNLNFGNPFIWNVILPSDFIFLFQNFTSINFANIQLSNSDMHGLNDIYKITIDSAIDVHYTHYRLSLVDTNPRVNGMDLLYRYAYKYVAQKYLSRCQRMIKNHQLPKFIICDNKIDLDWSLTDFDKLFQCTQHYPMVIFTDKDLSTLTIPDNVMLINQTGYFHDRCIDDNYKTVIDWLSL